MAAMVVLFLCTRAQASMQHGPGNKNVKCKNDSEGTEQPNMIIFYVQDKRVNERRQGEKSG